MIKDKDAWIRGLYILLFALLYGVAEVVLWACVLFQFGSVLLADRSNDELKRFCAGLNIYIYQILQFITYRTEEMPYPFAPWPDEESLCGKSEVEVEQEAEEEPQERKAIPPAEEVPSAQPPRDDEGESESGV